MKKTVFMFVVLVGTAWSSLSQYLDKNDQRYLSFQKAFDLIEQRHLTTWVETGTARHGRKNCAGDGCSTVIYSDFLTNLPGELYSVDIDPQAIAACKKGVYLSKNRIHFIVEDSIEFLRNFSKPIDFLYLDSYDFELDNPYPSQNHHLQKIIAAYDKLHVQSVVMIDDCLLPYGGKGALVIEYLLQRGWKIVFNGYQVILVQDV